MRKLVSLVILLFLVACGSEPAPEPTPTNEPTVIPPTETPEPTNTPEPTATAVPTISPTFLSRLDTFLNKASTLEAATSQGVNVVDFRDLLSEAKGSYALVEETWPESLDGSPMQAFNDAFAGWDLVLFLWELKIGDKDNPVEPDINGYQLIVDYGGENIVTDVHPVGYIVPEYRNKTFLPFDENIGVLMSLAADYFENGRTGVLTLTE